jgi:hypothetical protein
MSPIRIHVMKEKLDYDGSQLSSHFALRTLGIGGDSVVCFKGAMDIPEKNIADLEDLRQGAAICGSNLLHIIVEHFGIHLETAVLRQRILVRLAADLLRRHGAEVAVSGDDLYYGQGKLSVSIAAPSPVSCLIHLGINISSKGVPVKAASLDVLGVDPDRFAVDLADAYAKELESIGTAVSKVRGVP